MFDYRKVFDFIDHRILVTKLSELDIPIPIDFLSHRSQRVKLAEDCFSEWESVPLGVPQGTKLGINDLEVGNDLNASLWKYVDDATTSNIVLKENKVIPNS